MSDTVILALISAVAPTLASLAAVILAVRNGKKVKELHLAVNSRLDQLIATTKAESYAAGVKSETDKKGFS